MRIGNSFPEGNYQPKAKAANDYPIYVTKMDFTNILNRTEGKSGSELSAEQIKSLSDKYDIHNMTSKDEENLLGDLVEKGVFSKQEAMDIMVGFVPMTKAEFEARQSRTSLTTGDGQPDFGYKGNGIKDTLASYNQMVSMFDNYLADTSFTTMNYLRNNYNEFSDILARLSAEQNMVH